MSASTATAGSTGNSLVPLISEQYRIIKRLGGGSFGDIYLGLAQNGERVAVKFEKHSTRCPQLRHEYKVYRELHNCVGFGRVYYYGMHHSYNAMVMDLLGPSLEDLFNTCGRRFSLKTVLQIADQILERMEMMHSRKIAHTRKICKEDDILRANRVGGHLIHRDVKPANFVLGPGHGCQTVFCIDFGLSTRYRHPRTLQHIPYRDGRSLTGTPRYASINNHLGVEQSRRDDLESIGYVLLYLLKGSLPWQGLKARNAKRKYNMILERKQAISIQQLCQGLPQQFAEYLAYCRSLKFEAKPNVLYLQGLLKDLYKAQGHSTSGMIEWDWTKPEVQSESGTETSAGRGAITSGAHGEHGELNIPANDTLGSPVSPPVAMDGVITGTQAATPGSKSQPNGFSPVKTPGTDDCEEGIGDGHKLGISAPQAETGPAVDGDGRRHLDVDGRNLRPKTSSAFWAGAVRGWNARDQIAQSKMGAEPGGGTVPAATIGSLTLARGSPDRPSTSDAGKRGGASRSPSRRRGGVVTKSTDIATRAIRPHTAHGTRSNDANAEVSAANGDSRAGCKVDPVVAGARGMMRYRHERTGSATSGTSGAGLGLSRGCYAWSGSGNAAGGGRSSSFGRAQRTTMGGATETAQHRGSGLPCPPGAWGRGNNSTEPVGYARSAHGSGNSMAATGRPGTSGSGMTGITSRASRSSSNIAGPHTNPLGGGSVPVTVGYGRQRPLSARSRGLVASSRGVAHQPRCAFL